MDRDDFESLREWEEYLQDHPECMPMTRAVVQANKKVTATATLKYTILGLPLASVVQKAFISGTNVYTIQRKVIRDANQQEIGDDIYLSRCSINGNTAIYQDCMILKEFGHGQILEGFTHNSQLYFFVGCKQGSSPNYYSIQIGRIKYQPGVTISSYTSVCRLANLNYANKGGTSVGNVKRVEAAISSDQTKLLIGVRNNNNNLQYSYYNMSTINSLLDAKENETSKYVSFKDNSTLINDCIFSFKQNGDARVLPNNSCQGLEFSNGNAIYIAGGNAGEAPQIGLMKKSGNTYIYSSCVTIKSNAFGSKTEIEGLQLKGDDVYFAINGKDETTTTQYIYSVPKSVF